MRSNEQHHEADVDGAAEWSDARAATPAEAFYADLGDELVKRQVPFLNDILHKQLTLSGLFLGGSAMLDKLPIHATFRVPCVIVFLFALVAAFIGVLPYRTRFVRRSPDSVEAAIAHAYTWKRLFIWVSAGFLFLGMVVVLIGMLV